MPSLNDPPPESDKDYEQGRRHGYARGAQDVIDALREHLPPEKITRLKVWMNGVMKWRNFGDLNLEPPSPPDLGT